MSDTTPAPRRRTFFGFWLPILDVVVSGLGVAAVWFLPRETTRDNQNFTTLIIVVLALVVLALWMICLSGWRWYVRVPSFLMLSLLAGTVPVGVASSRIIFTGDMAIGVRWPWEKTPDQVVAEHRRAQPKLETTRTTTVEIGPNDWPEFRGRKRDGVATGPALSRDWAKHPPKLLWKQPCGPGWASFAVAGNVAVTIEQRNDNEAVIAYDVDTGAEVWKHEYPARFREPLGGPGPRATPTIVGGEVFSLGAKGDLVCLDGATGKLKWSANILGGRPNLQWGMSGSPLVVDDMVIVNPGRQSDTPTGQGAIAAHDRKTGTKVWETGDTKAGYASPMLTDLFGHRQIILFDGKQVGGFDVLDGTPLWNYPWDKTNQDINVAQPLVFDDGRVFISSGYAVGCAKLQLRNIGGRIWTVNEVWRNENKPLRCKFTNPVEHRGFIYGLDDGRLACIEAESGKLRWKDGNYGHGQLVRWDDLLIILSERGNLVLAEATPDHHRELGRIKAIEAERTWNVPALANGRIFVRNDREMACFDLRSE